MIATLISFYINHHFKVNTDISRLVKTAKQWSGLDQSISRAFPQRAQTVLVVVEAPSPEFADVAARLLTDSLKRQIDLASQ